MIGFLPILRKKLNTVYLGNWSRPNSKQATSHYPLKYGSRLFTKAFFSLGQLACDHHWLLFFFFPARLSSETLTLDVSCGAKNSSHDSMGINSHYPKTNFARNITLTFFIRSSCLALSCCGLMNFSFLPLFFLKYLLNVVCSERERQRSMGRFRRRTNRQKTPVWHSLLAHLKRYWLTCLQVRTKNGQWPKLLTFQHLSWPGCSVNLVG